MKQKDAHLDLTLVTLISDDLRAGQSASSDEVFPDKKLIFRWGDNPTTKGTFRVGKRTLEMLPVLQKKYAREMIPLDYEHNTVPGTPAHKESKEPREVAGHVTLSVVEGEGIYIHRKNITPSGERNIRNYPDLSPCIQHDKDGEILFISSVALTQSGSTHDLTLLNVPMTGINPETKENHAMDYRALLLKILRLDESAKDEDIQKAADALEKVELNEDPDKKKEETLSETIKPIRDEVSEIRARLDKRDRDALIERAGREGKVIPLSQEQLSTLPLVALSEMVDKLPVTVPLSARTPDYVEPQRVDSAAQSATQKEVCARLGIADDTWKKHNG